MTEHPNIAHAMNAIMSEIGAIGKDRRNQQQGFAYRGIDQAYAALQPLFVKHGVFTTSNIVSTAREERTTAKGGKLAFVTLVVEYTFHHVTGGSVTTCVVGEGMDSGDKASPKALAIAHKYALLQAFCVPTEAMVDPDAESHEVVEDGIEPMQISELQARIESTGTDVDKLCAHYGADKIDNLTKRAAAHAIRMLAARNTTPTGESK